MSPTRIQVDLPSRQALDDFRRVEDRLVTLLSRIGDSDAGDVYRRTLTGPDAPDGAAIRRELVLDDVPEITISHADTLDELGLEAIPDA